MKFFYVRESANDPGNNDASDLKNLHQDRIRIAATPQGDRSCYLQKKMLGNFAKWEYIGV